VFGLLGGLLELVGCQLWEQSPSKSRQAIVEVLDCPPFSDAVVYQVLKLHVRDKG